MFWRRGGLDKQAYVGLAAVVERPDVLAVGRGDGVLAVGTAGHIAVRDADGWRVAGWHEVDLARWDAETGVLAWSGPTNERLVLTEPGRLPMLLRDQVEASILVSERFLASGVQVQISGRRSLADPAAPLVWTTAAVDGRSLDRPGVRESAERRTAELRADVE